MPNAITANTLPKAAMICGARLKSMPVNKRLSMAFAVNHSSTMLRSACISSQVFAEPVLNQIRVKLMKLKVMKMPKARFNLSCPFFHGLILPQIL